MFLSIVFMWEKGRQLFKISNTCLSSFFVLLLRKCVISWRKRLFSCWFQISTSRNTFKSLSKENVSSIVFLLWFLFNFIAFWILIYVTASWLNQNSCRRTFSPLNTKSHFALSSQTRTFFEAETKTSFYQKMCLRARMRRTRRSRRRQDFAVVPLQSV